MSHDIEMLENGQASMFYAQDGGMPWHGLGQSIASAATAEEALRLANLDWKIEQRPAFFEKVIIDAEGQQIDEVYLSAPGYVMNVRDRDDQVMGVVTERYRPLQNSEAFGFLDELTDGFGAAKFETAMALNGGRRVNVTVRMPKGIVIAGDEIASYITVVNGHDGKTGVLVFATPIRVVCRNTENLAIAGANRTWKAQHRGNILYKMEEARETLHFNDLYLQALKKRAEELLLIPYGQEAFDNLVDKLFPEPESDSKTIRARWLERRAELHKCYLTKNLENFRSTGWGAIQAVSDFVGHERVSKTGDEKRYDLLIQGHPLLDLALGIISEKG